MDNKYKYIELHFDTAQKPVFKEIKLKNYVEFGEKNDYPKYLMDLFNESSKHGAIVKGKSNYVFGKGFENPGQANASETWNDLLKKCILDHELFNGYYLQVIWNRVGQISEVYHIDFQKVRISKDLSKFYVKNDWKENKEKPRQYDAFNVSNPYGSQILYKKSYNPMSEVYPLPTYFQALNYIESDIEVSRHILANAKRGWMGNTLVNLNNGEPPDEHKGEVEKALLRKFTGSDGKRVVIMFNQSKENSAEIVDLGNSILTKEDFTNINNLIQTEIFSGHQITSSVLFGISTPGTLGERNAIRDAYEIFNNTYVMDRQIENEELFTKLRNMKGEAGEFKIRPVEPLKFEFSETIMAQNLSKDEIREIMGRDPIAIDNRIKDLNDRINGLNPAILPKVIENITPNEIRQLAGLDSASGQISAPGEIVAPMASNEAIRNLTGRQYQNVMRIVRHFANGKLTKAQASLMLKSGFGFSDMDINAFLGIDDDPMTDDEIEKFNQETDHQLYTAFADCGEEFTEYEIVKSIPLRGHFAKEVSLTQTEADVLEALTNNKNINEEGIAAILKKDLFLIRSAIKALIDKDVIELNIRDLKKSDLNPQGQDSITRYKIKKPLSKVGGKEPEITDVFVRFTYEWRDDISASEKDLNRSRPFCLKMYQLSAHSRDINKPQGRTWSMVDIQNMSVRLGYSVLDRCGGWWAKSPQCKHEWVANLVTKKKNEQ